MGFIDPDGTVAIEPQFDTIMRFKNGPANIEKGNRRAYINRRGEYIWRSGQVR